MGSLPEERKREGMELSTTKRPERKRQSKRRAYDVQNLWERSNTHHRVKWQIGEQKAYDFFLNSQLTDEEEMILREAGMPTFIVNRVTPVIETMKYFVTANNPKYKAVGVDGTDSEMAEIHTAMFDYGWYISNGRAMFSNVVTNALTKGKGYFHVYVDPDADRGLGEVKIESVDSFCVYPSPMSSDFMERDAAYHIIKKDLPREALTTMLPEYADRIKRASGEPTSQNLTDRDFEGSDSIQPEEVKYSFKLDGTDDDILPYYEMYEPVNVEMFHVYIRPTIATQQMLAYKAEADQSLNVLQEELRVTLKEKEAELQGLVEEGKILKERMNLELHKANAAAQERMEVERAAMYGKAEEAANQIDEHVMNREELEAIQEAGLDIVRVIPFYEKRYNKTCVVGDQLLYEVELNTPYCPLVALPYLHTGTPYPMSATRPLIGKQQEINKAHQIMIHNANISSNFRWTYVAGEIDESTWENRMNAPSALLEYRPGYSPKGPQPVYPQPINNAFFTIQENSKTDLEYMAGIHPPSMGIGGGSDETYRGFLAKDEFATRRIKAWVANTLEPCLEHLGLVYQALAKDVYDIHKVFRIVQPTPSGGLEEVAFEINAPVYNDFSKVVGRYNDYGAAKYDLRIVAGSTLPVNRWAILEEYKNYYELGLIDDIAFLMETDIRDKDNIIKRKSMMKQLEGQIQSMEENLKEKQGTIETLSRQLVQANILGKVKDAEMEIDRDKTDTKMVEELTQERLRDELKLYRQRVKLLEQELKLKNQQEQVKQKEAKSRENNNKSEKK